MLTFSAQRWTAEEPSGCHRCYKDITGQQHLVLYFLCQDVALRTSHFPPETSQLPFRGTCERIYDSFSKRTMPLTPSFLFPVPSLPFPFRTEMTFLRVFRFFFLESNTPFKLLLELCPLGRGLCGYVCCKPPYSLKVGLTQLLRLERQTGGFQAGLFPLIQIPCWLNPFVAYLLKL